MPGLQGAKASLKRFGDRVAKVGTQIFRHLTRAFAAAKGAIIAAMYRAQEFNKQMAQIATVSDISMKKARRGVMRLSSELGLAKDELTKGLYDALSAGVPEDNAMTFLATAARAARAGATTTARSVDFLTSALNAFRIPASEAERVSDVLFQTVRNGKTTVEELGESFSKVGPIASASGVALEEVMAAAATLTQQGTPTAQAMTQIRAAIIAMNRELGDGWSATMTLQEGMAEMTRRAGGSNDALRSLTGRVEGMQAILGLTGENAETAARHLDSVTNSSGAMAEAFEHVEDVNPFDRLKQSLDNVVIVAGDAALTNLGGHIGDAADEAQRFAEAITSWADEGGLLKLQHSVEMFFEEFRGRWMDIVHRFHVGWSSISDAAATAIWYIVNIFKTWQESNVQNIVNLVSMFQKLWQAIRNPSREAFADALRAARQSGKGIIDTYVGVTDAIVNGVELQTQRTEEALAMQHHHQQEYADRVRSLQERQLAQLQGFENQKIEAAERSARAQEDIVSRTASVEISSASEVTRERARQLQTQLIAARDAGRDTSELARQMEADLQRWASETTSRLHQEVRERVTNEEEAARKIEEISEQMAQGVARIHARLTAEIHREQQARVANERSAARDMEQASESSASGTFTTRRVGGVTGSGGVPMGGDWSQQISRILNDGFGISPFNPLGGTGGSFMNAPPGSVPSAGAGNVFRTDQIVQELKGIRADNDKILRMG